MDCDVKIISGGQTGADRAALDFAIAHGIPHGGWIPKGRKAEDGPLPEQYQLKEMPTADYPKRTEQNVMDSNGTLIVSHGRLTGGSGLTSEMAKKHGRPCLHLDMGRTTVDEAAQRLREWIAENRIEVLNVAGPRQSKDPDIYDTALEVLHATFI
jgi:hypothetical protein